MDYKKLAEQIIILSGGKDNFDIIENCMTRVRITYHDLQVVNQSEIANLSDVLGINDSETFQVIVGPGKSVKLKEAIVEILNTVPKDEQTSSRAPKHFSIAHYLKLLADIFVPIIPAVIAAGFLNGVNTILTNSPNLLGLRAVLDILGQAAFGFLAIYVGISAAKQFQVNIIIGGVLGAASMSPSLELLGLIPGQGGLLGVILCVWGFSKIEKLLKKYIPDILDVTITPTFSLFFTGVLYFLLIMPIVGFLTDQCITGILFLIEKAGVFGGFLLAFAFPSLLTTGLHHGLMPIHMELINRTGSTAIFAVQLMGNAGLLGAGLALFILSKNPELKKIAKNSLPATFLAVGEPTLYRIVMPSGFGFITASLGAGFGGAMIRLLDVRTSAIGAAGMSALAIIADGKYLAYLLSYFIGFLASFLLTFLVGCIKK